ncbi:putative UDP-glucose 6-dehydrogenase [Gordonia alkanivorans NBRC 16433]|uniref:Putative UDP-glucose 6-dehydrogenase n=1 Tax=Gordonia alkanivorans NBRC 16433 TaxID=1027371 RepID=F9VVG6_9ACTN|nr:putative UDP-glucose 6-dehydrogenase [Gordonia alkanivorans NBRC 16433]
MRSFMAGEYTHTSVRRALIFTVLAIRATGFGSVVRGAAWATTGVNAAVISTLARPAIKRLEITSNSLPGKTPTAPEVTVRHVTAPHRTTGHVADI